VLQGGGRQGSPVATHAGGKEYLKRFVAELTVKEMLLQGLLAERCRGLAKPLLLDLRTGALPIHALGMARLLFRNLRKAISAD
jgi:hypothetical protein